MDFNDDNNSAQVETAILGSGGEQVDLSVSKTDSSDPVEPGDSLTYTVIVTNGGPSDATGVVLGDPLPFGVNFVSAQANQGSCAESAGFVACNLGSVESGASAGAEINVTIDPSVQVETLFNSAFADSDQEDTNGDNNFDQEETTVLVTSEPLAIFTTSLPNGLVEQAYSCLAGRHRRRSALHLEHSQRIFASRPEWGFQRLHRRYSFQFRLLPYQCRGDGQPGSHRQSDLHHRN